MLGLIKNTLATIKSPLYKIAHRTSFLFALILGFVLDILGIYLKYNAYTYSGIIRSQFNYNEDKYNNYYFERIVLTYGLYIFLERLFNYITTALYDSVFLQLNSQAYIETINHLNRLTLQQRGIKSDYRWESEAKLGCSGITEFGMAFLRASRNATQLSLFSYSMYKDGVAINYLLFFGLIAIGKCKFMSWRTSKLNNYKEFLNKERMAAHDKIHEVLTLHEIIQIKNTCDHEKQRCLQAVKDADANANDLFIKRLYLDFIKEFINVSALLFYIIMTYYMTFSRQTNNVHIFEKIFSMLLNIDNSFNGLLSEFQEMREGLHKVKVLIGIQNILPIQGNGKRTIKKVASSLEFKDVTFIINNKMILNKVNFVISATEKVALIGEIGSGKSTIAKLILRLYEKTKGRILIDNIDIGDYSISSLRKSFSYIPQQSYIISDTIYSNITYGEEHISKSNVIYASKMSGISQHLLTDNRNVDTKLTNKGKDLSGGQRQELSISRSFLREHSFYIFDEPTQSLDPVSSKHMINSIFTHTKNSTILMITHDIEVAKKADRILLLKDGKVIEQDKLTFNYAENRFLFFKDGKSQRSKKSKINSPAESLEAFQFR